MPLHQESFRCAALLMVGLVLLVSHVGAAAAGEVEGSQAIVFLNEQRAANGIPPVTENQEFAAAWCPGEDHGLSGGESARDLSSDVSAWSATSSPWDNAPLHQQDMYNPLYTEVGDVDVEDQACLGVGVPLPEPAVPSFAAFYSDTGPEHVPTTETIYGEGPFAPQQLVGLPLGKPTGGQIILYAEGMGSEVHALSWTLTEPDGNPVPNVKLVGEVQASDAEYAGYLDGVGIVIPPPLKAFTSYNLSVVWEGANAMTATQTLFFKTAGAPNPVRVYGSGGYLYGESTAPRGVLTVSRAGHTLHVGMSARTHAHHYRGRLAINRLSSGRWTVCVTSGGGTTGYQAEQQCLRISIRRY